MKNITNHAYLHSITSNLSAICCEREVDVVVVVVIAATDLLFTLEVIIRFLP